MTLTEQARSSPRLSRSPRKPPTIPVEPKLRTATRIQDRTLMLAWMQVVKGQSFRFFDLPAEIRNRIYECLCVGRLVTISCGGTHGGSRHKYCQKPKHFNNRQPALSRTCRQARGELLPMFYARNMFQLACRRHFVLHQIWMDTIDRHHKYLRRVRIVREWPGELTYNIDVFLNHHEASLERAITVRCSAYLTSHKAHVLARRVSATLETCTQASRDDAMEDEEVRGYALMQVVKALAQKGYAAPRLLSREIVSPVVGPHAHFLIYPEMWESLMASNSPRSPEEVTP